MDLEELLDTIQALRAKRDSVVAMYDDAIETKRAQLEQLMKENGEEKIRGELATAFFQRPTTVKVDDWNEVFKFVKEKGAFDIIQKRVSPAALQKRIEAGEKIKGVTVVKGELTLAIRSKKEGESDSE